MDSYLLHGHILKCKVVPKEKVHPTMWVGANRRFKKIPHDRIARVRHNKVCAGFTVMMLGQIVDLHVPGSRNGQQSNRKKQSLDCFGDREVELQSWRSLASSTISRQRAT